MADIDIAIDKNDEGIFDIAIESGDFKKVGGFDTQLKMSLFAERRADSSEQPVAELRRGWWGNLVGVIQGFENGSKLWLLEQARLTQDTLNKAVDYARECLQWMVEDGHLINITVEGEFLTIPQQGIRLTIVLIRDNGITETKYFDLWENTGFDL